MHLPEIVLDITQPETEWIGGRPVRKMSPTFSHSRVQTILAILLEQWSDGRGRVATEWRFRLAPTGEVRRPLVPDVAFVSIEKLRDRPRNEIEIPDFAPDVAFEVRSPGDRQADIEQKIDVFLRCGTQLVAVVDPLERSVTLHDGSKPSIFRGDAVVGHAALPGFELALAAFFARALDL